MPHNFDFSKISKINTININADGWITPLCIEYGIIQEDQLPLSCYWRVKGTLHTFVIPLARLDFLTSGEYYEHFKETLQGFREEYCQWKQQGFNHQWMSEYYKQYSSYIIT